MARIPLKITSGSYKRTQLQTPKDERIRPTQHLLRQALVNYLSEFVSNARVLDLYAGTGVVGLEMLSNGAHEVTFVDIAKKAVFLIEKNVDLLGVKKQTTIAHEDVLDFLTEAYYKKQEFDIIFIDPPYTILDDLSEINQQEFLEELIARAGALLSDQSVLIIKLGKKMSLPVPPRLKLLESRTYGMNVLHYIIPDKKSKLKK